MHYALIKHYELIKHLRKLHNVTQKELAEELNVARGTLANYETGKRTPDFSTLTVEEMKKYAQITAKNNQAAQIVIATVPIMLIYPFLQKYFMSGLTMGSVKG